MLLAELIDLLEAALSNVSQRQAKWDEEERLKGARHKKWDAEHQREKNFKAGKLSPEAEQVLIFARKNPQYISQMIDMLVGVKGASAQMESTSLLERVNQDSEITAKSVMQLWNQKGKPRELYSVARFLEVELGFDQNQIKKLFKSIDIGYDPERRPNKNTGKTLNPANNAAPAQSNQNAMASGMPQEVQQQVAALISKVDRREKRNLVKQLKGWAQREKDVAKRQTGKAGIITSPRG